MSKQYELNIFNYTKEKLPWTNFKICWYCSLACDSLTRSILFCKIKMCFSFIISIAAKCSDVCGCGHDSFPAIIDDEYLENFISLYKLDFIKTL